MREKRLYDTRFFVEYFYSGDAELLRRLKEDLRAVRERMVSALTVHEMHRIIMNPEAQRYFDGVCSKCIFRRYCAPGCLAYAFRFYETLSSPNPMCQRVYDADLFPKDLLIESF